MEILLERFHEKNGIRQFAFDCVAADRSRTKVTVRADVSLARKHNIRLQELPLLCRRLLDSVLERGLKESITLTEDHMAAIETAARDLAEKKTYKPVRRSPAVGHAWRSTDPANRLKSGTAEID